MPRWLSGPRQYQRPCLQAGYQDDCQCPVALCILIDPWLSRKHPLESRAPRDFLDETVWLMRARLRDSWRGRRVGQRFRVPVVSATGQISDIDRVCDKIDHFHNRPISCKPGIRNLIAVGVSLALVWTSNSYVETHSLGVRAHSPPPALTLISRRKTKFSSAQDLRDPAPVGKQVVTRSSLAF